MIRLFDYRRSLEAVRPAVEEAFRRVLDSGHLILGPETEAFEAEFATFTGSAHCVAVGSGTQALQVALAGLGVEPGAEVVTVPNTCAPTVAGIRLAGGRPVLVDVRTDTLMMDVGHLEEAITTRTGALVPVHLWGNAVDMSALMEIADRRGVPVVEDAAQAHGTVHAGRHAGTFGSAGCFSFYPTKNLGAFGDAGAVVTDDRDLARRMRLVRMYGYDGGPISTVEGGNFRISEIQAAILRVKLGVLRDHLARRREVAAIYDRLLPPGGAIRVPTTPGTDHSFHQYVVRCPDRPALQAALDAAEVQHGTHYPVPVHRMPAYGGIRVPRGGLPVAEEAASSILSLPVHESLTDAEAVRVAEVVAGTAG